MIGRISDKIENYRTRFSNTKVIRNINNILKLLFAAIFILVCLFVYQLHQYQKTTSVLIEKMKQESVVSRAVMIDEAAKPVKKNKNFWMSLQQELKDTVVQVYSQKTEFNWLEPYKTPTQGESYGSAFFISELGELITNAHVVDQAKANFVQIPSLSRRKFEVDVIGVSPERDLALLRLKPYELEAIKKSLKKDKLPYLEIGNSDSIYKTENIVALGYPLGQQGLKSTIGVVSGREHLNGQYYIQTDAPLNPGNSGGPSLNNKGEVIGVNSAIIQGAQNVGYIIPSNEVKLFLKQINDMPETGDVKLLRKPYLGILFNDGNESLTSFLKNPSPGGLYVVEVLKGSPLAKAGVQKQDMIYEIDGHQIDIYGQMQVAWNEDRISILDYISRLKIDESVHLVLYRHGERKELTVKLSQRELAPIRRVYPGYEKMDYEVFAGMVVMPLSLNHVVLLVQYAPDLVQFADFKKQFEPQLLVTHVQLNSPVNRTRVFGTGALLAEVNDVKVKTLEEFRKAILKSLDTGFLTLKTTENMFVVLSLDDIMQSEERLSDTYHYPLSNIYKELLKSYKKKQK